MTTLIPILICLWVSVVAAQQRIVEHPADARVVVGQTALLRCRVENQVGVVTWSKNRFLLGAERSLPSYPRYSMIGSSARGEYNLEIRNVTISDDAEYQCQVSGVKSMSTVSNTVRLTVLVPPSEPRLDNFGPMITAAENEAVNVYCISDGGKPAPNVHWFIASQQSAMDVVRTLQQVEDMVSVNQAKLSTVKSQLRYDPPLRTTGTMCFPPFSYLPRRNEDGQFLVCQVNHEALVTPLVTAAALNIHYSPKVTVTLNSSVPLQEGGSATFLCHAEAKPDQNLRYSWSLNSNIIQKDMDRVLRIANLQYMHHRAVLKCEVTNAIGTGSGSYSISLHYSPRLPQKDSTVLSVDEKKTAVLRCNVDANPIPSVRWFRLGSDRVIGEGVNLTIPHVTSKHQGTYLCEARVPGYAAQKLNTVLLINGAPQVSMVPVKEAVEGNTVDIVCFVTGYPLVDKITWYKGDVKIDTEQGMSRYEKSKIVNTSDGVFNILKIINVHGSDFDLFNCSASNEYGSGWAVTNLVASDPIPLHIMIPGVIAGCVAIIALAAALCLVNRKYLCRSKLSMQGSQDPSDVTVKVEALDAFGRPYQYLPDLYNGGTLDQSDIVFNKDYISIPQENPDLDCLPPPFPAYFQEAMMYTNAPMLHSPVIATPVTPAAKGAALASQVMYLSDRSSSSPQMTADNANGSFSGSASPLKNGFVNNSSMPYPVERFVSTYRPYGLYGIEPNGCYPTSILSPPLETVIEVPTPDTLEEHRRSTSSLLRCSSQNSTHV